MQIGQINMAASTIHIRSLASTLILLLLTPATFSSLITPEKAGIASVRPRAGNWAYVGCYSDSVGARTLSTNPSTAGGVNALTNEICTARCESLGFSIAGTEYSGECFCGNSIANGGAKAVESTCNMACYGNSSQICGGPNRLSVWDLNGFLGNQPTGSSTSSGVATSSPPASTATAIPGWTHAGCYTDAVGARALGNQIWNIPGENMSPIPCTAACKAGGYILAGVEYGGECYCGNSILNDQGPAPEGLSGCYMPCNGNAAFKCGGPNRLNIYNYTASASSSSGTSSQATTSSGGVVSSSTKTTTSATPVSTILPTGWSYKGCWIDQAHGRILGAQLPDSDTMTIQSCVNGCRAQGYSIAGLEYHTQCFCGTKMINQAAQATSESDCNTPCGGNSGQICGGGDRMSIYSNQTTLSVQPVASNQKTGLPGSWNYTGCIYDDAILRTFPYQSESDNNTATSCLSQCQKFGYGAGGMEFHKQCFCGDVADVLKAGAATYPESDCNTVCTGDENYYCGGPNRISYYTWTGSPLDLWDFPAGNAAGEYQFLIGGVTIPLIVSPAVNGKVTYLEKFGTSPAGNGTGAYELDLASINNFTAAWRPMHVKTDIFCAAGLTMPDKVGRQINFGGWANDATYRIRLYWPDGSPGVWGKNDWQEAAGVDMLDGRWYPTAMTLANGSMLIVGGEEGSNGAAVPTIEVIPTPPGVTKSLYADYLARTDPNNLYPYTVVLPGGDIFIAYYNEARILDEVTLQTKKILPNIPGAVNDPAGGRTYPWEGTAMVLPQHAPYTDPLTVIICGGSTPFSEIGLDNCVTIQPTVADPKWTIERMPSRRVISCMAALPDGTYLINNGAHLGRAGFQLGNDPNLNAVLYDPSKPLHRRMSVMANTTVARLYHSSTVLLDDARLLVTGSDPEEPGPIPKYPQEYRNEVFIPPYLKSGLPRPAFTITTANRDVAYGGSFQITVTAGTVSRISLMAAVSSTHGNSMGQRTLFPAFSCSGNTCTIQAPPNAHVSPPAWHQVFILDGPTPSIAHWVRIGGDPASLGNWPNNPAFDVPGMGPVGGGIF